MLSDMVDALDIKQNLEKLGLDQQEAEIYVFLSNNGTSSVLDISRATDIPRTTVYRLAESLVDKKFAKWIIEDTGKQIKATRPKNLGYLIQEKKEELEETEHAIEQLEEMLSTQPEVLPRTQIRYYQGKKGMRQLIWNTLKAKEAVYGESLYEWEFLVGEKFLAKYNEEFRLKQINDQTLVNEDTIDKVIRKFHTSVHHQDQFDLVRVIPKEKLYISGDTIIYDNIFASVFWKQGEIFGIEIENKELAKMQLSLFKNAWQKATPLQKFLEAKRFEKPRRLRSL